jgi:4-amino-4-deoxy-L-arabinose transferase-like glycosyltransferase
MLAVVGLTVLAALLRFWRLGHQGFWFDEGNTALLVQFSPGKMLGLIPQSESTPPLYYCVAWVWSRVFGHTEVGLRSLSALLGVATVPAAYLAGAKLVSRRAGVIACALTAFNPLLIWYSQEARSYQMLVFLSSVALVAFAYAREDPTPRRLVLWVVASALALGTHYYAILAIAPQALWLLRGGYRHRRVQVGVGVVALCGAALIPLALSQGNRGLANWISTTPIGHRFGQVWPQFVLGFGSPAWDVLKWVALAMALVGLALLVLRASGAARRGGLLALGLAVAGLVLNLLVIAGGIDDLITRNVMALWMPAAVAVAAGMAVPRPRWLGGAAALVLCGCGVVAAVGVATSRGLERPDWRVVARALGARPAASVAARGGRAIFIQHYRDLLPLKLYMPGLKASGRRGATVSELDIISFTSPPSDGFCWWGAGCNLWPSVMQASYEVRGFHPVGRRQVLQFTILRMVASHPVRVTPHEIARTLQTTHPWNDELLVQR